MLKFDFGVMSFGDKEMLANLLASKLVDGVDEEKREFIAELFWMVADILNS